MSEQFLVEQLNEAIDAIIGRRDAEVSSGSDSVLTDLSALAVDLQGIPRESFKASLKEELRRSATMTTTAGTETQPVSAQRTPGYQTITPYLTVRRAEQLVEFVKNVFGGTELYRTTGSAGGLHAEVVIGDSKLMIGGYETVEEMPTALHLYVPDADAVYQRALEAGSTSLEEPVDQFYGDREAGIKDRLERLVYRNAQASVRTTCVSGWPPAT